MTQLNMFKTQCNNILDLVLTNDPLTISNLKYCTPFGSSDHSSLSLCTNSIICPSVDFCDEQANPNVVHFSWSRGDWVGFGSLCSEFDWNSALSTCTDSDAIFSVFSSFIHVGINIFIPALPLSNVFSQGKRRVSRIIANLLIKKKMLWHCFCVNRADIDKLNYKLCTKEIINTRNRLSTHFEKIVICSRNLGVFYKHINSRMNHRAGVAPLCDPLGNMVIDDGDKANFLNNRGGRGYMLQISLFFT